MDFLAFTIIVQVNQQSQHLQYSCPLFYVLYNIYIYHLLMYFIIVINSPLTAPHGEWNSPVEKVALFVYIQI